MRPSIVRLLLTCVLACGPGLSATAPEAPTAKPLPTVAQALVDPSVLARKMVVPVNHLGEEIQMLGNPIKMSEMGEEVFVGAPTLGQHTEQVLSEYLGYSKERIANLKKEKVI